MPTARKAYREQADQETGSKGSSSAFSAHTPKAAWHQVDVVSIFEFCLFKNVFGCKAVWTSDEQRLYAVGAIVVDSCRAAHLRVIVIGFAGPGSIGARPGDHCGVRPGATNAYLYRYTLVKNASIQNTPVHWYLPTGSVCLPMTRQEVWRAGIINRIIHEIIDRIIHKSFIESRSRIIYQRPTP